MSRPRPDLSRRSFLAAGGAGALLAGAGPLAAAGAAAADASSGPGVVDFHGQHQAGIATPVQNHLSFATFDLAATTRSDVADLLRTWTTAAAALCAGQPVGALDEDLLGPPADTGEAVGTGPAHLTLTFGFGPGLFAGNRFGLAARRPPALVDLPSFPGEQLDPARGGGDLAVQACADDPLVAFHAVHNLARLARGAAVLRWSQLGFGRTASATRHQETPRNLMGFKDGTNNIRADDGTTMARDVWVGTEGPSWMRDGTYLVVRRIRMRLERWDRSPLDEQEQVIGRSKTTGAPLGATDEFSPVDLAAVDSHGDPVVPERAHIRLASPSSNGGRHLLRRGYSFDEGVDELGEQSVGLFFMCYQRDPARQFVAVQQRLAANDALNEYVVHIGSAVFACPGGVTRGSWVGQALFD
jgi:deferrochelatase/peroxidase EfeB